MKHNLCVPTNVILTCVRYSGVIVTGSHGTGWNNPPVCDSLTAMTLINSNGEVESYSAETHGEDFVKEISVNFGLLVIH